MQVGRSVFGLGAYKRVVYVFGGWAGTVPLRECEKLQRKAPSWTLLPLLPQTSPYRYSACLYHGQFYLSDCTSILIFHPVLDIFRLIHKSVSIPQSCTTATIVNNELLIISESGVVARWRLGSECSLQVSEIEQTVAHFSVLSSLVQVGKVIYWLKVAYFLKTDLGLRPIAGE